MYYQGYFTADFVTLQEAFLVNLYAICGLIPTGFLNM